MLELLRIADINLKFLYHAIRFVMMGESHIIPRMVVVKRQMVLSEEMDLLNYLIDK